MNEKTYRKLARKLNNISDIEKFEKRYKRGVLLGILTQKIIERTKRTKINKKEIAELWKEKSILEISEEKKIPPFIVAKIILGTMCRKDAKKLEENPSLIEDERLREEVEEAYLKDFVYSPLAVEFQKIKGIIGEELIEEYLIKKGVEFFKECDLKSNKTPDFLTEEQWFESKVFFANRSIHRNFFKKQYKHYLDLFGSGTVVYWLGYVKGVENLYKKKKKKLIVRDYKYFKRLKNFNKKKLNRLLEPKIYTIGYSGRSIRSFIRKLEENDIDAVVDVRRFPTSKIDDFKKENLKKLLEENGIKYVHLEKLGGYRSGGYEKYMLTKDFKSGIKELLWIFKDHTLALMCMERDYRRCHRRFISKYIEALGIKVLHV